MEYVGGEFILSVDNEGLWIKRNVEGHGRGELFEWDEIKHILAEADNKLQAKNDKLRKALEKLKSFSSDGQENWSYVVFAECREALEDK